ncbi:hypothetical protein CIL03_07680 [Virgibacillus indicus]|uniref:DUF4030 domain-containing protein n=1 Tax=Virgibacillus indicus TaxID=2024554 RepID=A0A265NA66_9BACI|nr:DUF4030 domain-containing protein [Virgibacillus indicus]OZU88893.1 hypothetical protein CIL03_07680 [Virgibacillus indicus]
MKRTCLTLTFLIFAILSSFGVLFYTTGSANADSLTDKIKESMEETEERKQLLEQFNLELNNRFKESGFKGDISISGEDFPFGKINLNIAVNDNNYKKANEKQIRKLIEKVLSDYDINDIEINIKVHESASAERTEEEKKQAEQFDDIFTIAEKELTNKNYLIATMGIDSQALHIEIKITGNNNSLKQDKEMLEKRIHDQIFSKYQIDYTITINTKSDEEIREEKWHPIFTTIREEMNKQFDEVTGFAHSFQPKPLQIIIKTSLPSGNQESKKLAGNMEAYVHGIIKIKSGEASLEKEAYRIIIKNKDQEKLN